jgi:hypothetical protein
MRTIHYFLIVFLVSAVMPLAAQTPVFEDLIFETDSITSPYKPAGKNYVLLKSKRGADGMPKTPKGDSIIALPITDIVLVFSELNPDAINNRVEANQERWENLLKAYPQFFQFSTNYKEMCQCKNGGDAELFKEGQGFYIYYAKPEPKKVETPVATTKAETKEPETKTKTEKSKIKEENEPKELAVKSKEKEPVKEKEKVVKEKSKKEKEKEKDEENEPAEAGVEGAEQTLAVDMSKEAPKKRTGYTKPKRSKDLKACRPPCYEGGDDDLNTFFKENIVLSKKQKRQVKSSVSTVKLQLNFDGSIKKALVNGTNPILNEMVTNAIKNMDLWNPMVKGGVTVKSEVKLTLKYDKSTKAIRPFETMITPRPNPKCVECKSDSEMGFKD